MMRFPFIQNCFKLVLGASLLLIGCNNVPTALSVELTSVISEDATPEVLKTVLSVEEKNISLIKFEKGVYHFYPDKGLESFQYISNHGDLMVKAAFPIKGLKNLTIDGQGSQFIFHGVMIPFLIEKSNNITVKNLSIDWERSFHSEGLIVANDSKKKTFDMQISEDYPYEIRNGQIYFLKEYYEHDMGQTILYDPKRVGIAFDTESYTSISTKKRMKNSTFADGISYKYEFDKKDLLHKKRGVENKLTVKELKPGLVRVHGHKKKMPPVGTILTMKGEQGYNRVAPAFRVSYTDTFQANNVTIHHAGGMGIIAENSIDLTLDGFNVTPSRGRMVSTTADATHFVGCRGKVIIRNCTLRNQLDDASNIHGTYQKIVDVIDEYTLGVRMGHHQQNGFVIGRDNDNIGFVRLSDSFFAYDKATIKNIRYVNGKYQIITFNEKLPQEVKVGDLIENLDAYPELLVEDCVIKNNRARGLLLSTPKKTTIKNNFFSTEMEAILIPLESGYWYESGNGQDITITDNVFQDCQHSGFDRGVIRLDTDDDNANVAFKNIDITNNVFNQFDNLILQVTNVDGLNFKHNKITNSGTFPQLHPKNPAVVVKHSKNVEIDNNDYQGNANEFIKEVKE